MRIFIFASSNNSFTVSQYRFCNHNNDSDCSIASVITTILLKSCFNKVEKYLVLQKTQSWHMGVLDGYG